MPKILLHKEENSSQSINIFEEDKETLDLILTPLAQTYDVMIETIVIVEGWIEVEVTSKKHGNISKFITATKQLLPKKLILFANVIEHIIKRLSDAQKKISFAESCTGGLLSYYFTKNNGVSSVFDGSLITYSNELKQNWLGIVSDILEINGAVSPEVVHEMSNGVINVSEADYAISISGIAGEGGGTPEKPVGTVYIGIKTKEMDKEVLLNLKGDRNYIQHQSSLYAIKILLLSDKSMFF
jgi:nicotinamide-nucleotide amidase